jgi:uncharacterized protein (TIGR03437 family)
VAGSLGTVMGSRFSGNKLTVTFDGLEARVLYADDKQINLHVPLELASRSSASLVVAVDGARSAPQIVPLAPAWPSVFANGVFNQDNSVNSAAAAAKRGSFLQIFATGIPAGAIVTAEIGSRRDLIPVYAGEAPTVLGVQQVNVAVPEDVETSEGQLVICASVGGQKYCSAPAPLSIQAP